MAALATIHVTMTPELREAIDHLAPVVRASEQLFDCMCEFSNEPSGLSACSEYEEAWDAAMVAYKAFRASVSQDASK